VTTIAYGSSRSYVGEPLEMMTIERRGMARDIHVAALVDTGATLCQIPESFLQQAGYTTTNLPKVSFGTAKGKATAGLIDVDLYIFKQYVRMHRVLCIDNSGPSLIGRSLLDLALEALGYEGRKYLLHYKP
jgi:predicted aspartyl protease